MHCTLYFPVFSRFSILGFLGLSMVLCGCLGKTSQPASLPLTRSPYHAKPITVWFDATANWERLGSREQVGAMMDKCLDTGVDIVVIDVKPISGYVLYNSRLAPRLTEWKGIRHDPDFDLLAVACEEGRRRNLRVFASMNFFAEGHYGAPGVVGPHGILFERPDRRSWISVDYVVPEGREQPVLLPADQYQRGHAVFVSPVCPEALEYELALVREICAYPIDGICLDRVRFSGITSDFSPWARRSFEAYLGKTVARWPDDIFTYKRKGDRPATDAAATTPDTGERIARGANPDFERVPGPLYKQWLVWRAKTVRDVILKARAEVHRANPACIFADYTGAWYPDYYNEGVNWASPDYNPSADYPEWALPEYQDAAYAHLLELLYSGWYYTHVTEADAEAAGVAPWASMEGTARLIQRVVRGACPVHGSLYLFQYKDNPGLFRRCMRHAYDLSDGLMLFDLIYLEEYGWWSDLRATFPERIPPTGINPGP